MVNVTSADVITEETIRRVVEDAVEENLLWDAPYRELSFGDEIGNDVINIPIDQDTMGDVELIEEGAEFPRDEEDYDTVAVRPRKYGMEVAITREAEMNSIFDIVAQQVDKKSRRMAEKLNTLAFEELDANLHPNSSVTDADFNFDLIVDGRKELLDDAYTPQVMIANVAAEAELLKTDEYQRATDQFDATITEGAVGRTAGLDVFVSNDGNLDDDPAAIIVDPDRYGYEVIREDIMTQEYEDPGRHARVFQIWTNRTFKAIDENAAIKVEQS